MNEKLFYFILTLAMITNAVWIIGKIHKANLQEKENIALIQKIDQQVDDIHKLMDGIKTRIEILENK